MSFTPYTMDPTRDLELVREVPVAPELVWRAWTESELMKQWFTPKPWETTHAEVEQKPGGRFSIEMRGPNGETGGGGDGCVLDVIPNERLVWTAALGPGYRPQDGEMLFTGIIELTPNGSGGTHYRAIVIHGDEETSSKHAELGFEQGWGAALDQLVELMS